MAQKIIVKCERCGSDNVFDASDLVSGMSIKDDEGNVVKKHPPVEIDELTFIQCEHCGAPVSCANATFANE